MAIYYLQVLSLKLSNRELSKVFDAFNAQGRLQRLAFSSTNISEKAWAIRSKFREVTASIPEQNLQVFIERAK